MVERKEMLYDRKNCSKLVNARDYEETEVNEHGKPDQH